jgi:hypothetical protein
MNASVSYTPFIVTQPHLTLSLAGKCLLPNPSFYTFIESLFIIATRSHKQMRL